MLLIRRFLEQFKGLLRIGLNTGSISVPQTKFVLCFCIAFFSFVPQIIHLIGFSCLATGQQRKNDEET